MLNQYLNFESVKKNKYFLKNLKILSQKKKVLDRVVVKGFLRLTKKTFLKKKLLCPVYRSRRMLLCREKVPINQI